MFDFFQPEMVRNYLQLIISGLNRELLRCIKKVCDAIKDIGCSLAMLSKYFLVCTYFLKPPKGIRYIVSEKSCSKLLTVLVNKIKTFAKMLKFICTIVDMRHILCHALIIHSNLIRLPSLVFEL